MTTVPCENVGITAKHQCPKKKKFIKLKKPHFMEGTLYGEFTTFALQLIYQNNTLIQQ